MRLLSPLRPLMPSQKYQFWADKEEATDTTGGTHRRESEISAHWIFQA